MASCCTETQPQQHELQLAISAEPPSVSQTLTQQTVRTGGLWVIDMLSWLSRASPGLMGTLRHVVLSTVSAVFFSLAVIMLLLYCVHAAAAAAAEDFDGYFAHVDVYVFGGHCRCRCRFL